ncbi:ribonucleotide-diphosphate reductase subunit rnr1 [Sarracenia purpurea var. burkii]
MKRGTSVFLPTATYPMFPERLAMEGMSLKQGKLCKAVTVSVVLHSDGRVVMESLEYMEMCLNLQFLSPLSEYSLGAIDTSTLETRIKVENPDDPEPSINLYVENQADPAMRLVTEMMILCGEAIATYAYSNNLSLPFRGQPQSDIDLSAFAHLPEGPVRSSAIVKIMRAAEMDFRKPIRHGILGIPGYVQFTSPIRRYMDLLAHYQVKAFLRGHSPPFSAGQLEGMASLINMNIRIVKRVCSSSLRYWILEYLRRQPKERRFRALILRFIKDRIAALLLVEIGMQASAWVSVGVQIGDEVEVQVEEAHPRDDVLSLKEVVHAV